jgi:hypothetical protein
MDKNDLERRLEAAEKQNLGLLDEIQNLKAKLAEMQDVPEIPDLPNFKCGESYWTMLDNFVLSDERTAFVRDATEYNMFHTEAYAQEFANKCKLIAMMLHCKWYLCYNHHPDFNDGDIQKWTVVFDYKKRKFSVEFSRTREWSTVYFDTEENAKKCAEWLNKHWSDCDD